MTNRETAAICIDEAIKQTQKEADLVSRIKLKIDLALNSSKLNGLSCDNAIRMHGVSLEILNELSEVYGVKVEGGKDYNYIFINKNGNSATISTIGNK